MRRVWIVAALLVAPVAFAQTVTAPSATVNVAPAADYATRAFQDPWDMSQVTDLGWFLWEDAFPPNITNISFASGVFSGTTTDDPRIFLLDTPIPGTAKLGRVGSNYPIDADTYTLFAIRMRVDQLYESAQLFWGRPDLYTDMTISNPMSLGVGWHVYVFSIPDIGIAAGTTPWSGQLNYLRLDPNYQPENLKIDWIRLVQNVPGGWYDITWTGTSRVDVFLDDDSNPANGNLGMIATNTNTGTLHFYVAGLPQGDYWVAVAPHNGSPTANSAGHFHVDGIPTLTFTSPSPEGSSDDFATEQLHNAWDMDSTADVDSYASVTSPSVTSMAVQRPDGSTTTMQVYTGTSTQGTPVGDPRVWPLYGSLRGADTHIDPDRYRILTFDLGLPGNRDLNPTGGSIARVVWRNAGETLENVSADIVVRHRAGAVPTVDRITADLKTLPLEDDAGGSPAKTGWTVLDVPDPGIESFRIDPHEFSAPTAFYLGRVKLASLERFDDDYRIAWSYQASGSPATLALYWDDDATGYDGHLIAAGLDPTEGGYDWYPTGLQDGSEYYIYGVLSRAGVVLNRSYARWPLVKVASSPQPLPGDVNADARVDAADVFCLVDYLFHSGPVPPGISDVNGDGAVTVGDVFSLVRRVFGAP